MRTTLLFGAVGLAAALATTPGLALAQTYMPGEAPAPVGNFIGGGGATLTGGGDDMTIAYFVGGAGGGGTFAQAGRLARIVGNDGDGLQIDYPVLGATVPGAGSGREASLLGGGEDIRVVYSAPR
jgi:hypothetical protein